jgi:murein DD-endopeptidase MepM/ murein hydrolase activator NlpD
MLHMSRFMLSFRRASAIWLVLLFASSALARESWTVRWQPERLVNGSPLVLRVSAPQTLASLSGKWLEHDVFFSFDQASRTWYAIAGVSLETKPGKYSLVLTGKTEKGKEVSFQRLIAVSKGKYQQIAVTVAKQYTEPSPEQLQEINQDKTLKQQVFAHVEPEREWAGKFSPPVDASISDVFGTARTFNGQVQSVHQGLDFRVPTGTVVDALNAGTVLLARPLFFEGGCVVIDHGQGLMTIYMHLSEMKVKEGEQVKRGQEIALSGGTGRATGPHRHVAVRWQGVYLDPKTLLSLNLP